LHIAVSFKLGHITANYTFDNWLTCHDLRLTDGGLWGTRVIRVGLQFRGTREYCESQSCYSRSSSTRSRSRSKLALRWFSTAHPRGQDKPETAQPET